MSWKLDKNRPICPQICERLCVEIAGGVLAPHERLCSVRELAVRAGVNPNTVQKAFEQLEAQGLIYSVRGSGWFVSESTEDAATIVKELTLRKTSAYFEEMSALGYSESDVKEYIKEWRMYE